MESFAAAYVMVWLAVVLFVVRMALKHNKLRRSFESLRLQVQSMQDGKESRSRAA